MKLITVIIPVYNVKPYLSKCLESVGKQSYKNLEIILVDDGSDDGSFSICKEFSKRDSRIKLYHTKNLGLSHARNVGLDHANGKYIVFVDSDDYIHENMISTMMDKAEDADLVICNYKKVLNDTKKKIPQDAKCLKDDSWNYKQFWEHYYLKNLNVFCCVAWNKLYKRKLFKNIRYPINEIHEDEYIINDIVSRCNKIKIINDVLYYYVQRGNSIMHNSYQGYMGNAEAFIGRCDAFQNRNLVGILRENLNEIPGLLVKGFNESQNRSKYRFLRQKYILYLKQYLKNNYSAKLLLKKWMLMIPSFYNLYIDWHNKKS
ncbi:glycosyl transferase family 2 [Pediococcus damnosus LMG 28219]|uniref:glycosyltransferase family 2 protein n=1 Tax=Pediococcus damnosus TaxID=51663 RepID=UPI00061EF68C|nr:glycosyltransferase family 2 protein [Pediococcus damnosus]KJU73400.1 glycosyl transferase family 2 [Pediococcus damnosus LMG 28219]